LGFFLLRLYKLRLPNGLLLELSLHATLPKEARREGPFPTKRVQDRTGPPFPSIAVQGSKCHAVSSWLLQFHLVETTISPCSASVFVIVLSRKFFRRIDPQSQRLPVLILKNPEKTSGSGGTRTRDFRVTCSGNNHYRVR